MDQHAAEEPTADGMAAQRFAEQLRTLRAEVGNPSFRRMAGQSGRISHTTLHEAAAGTRFPSWETTREFVRACDADEAEWRRRWEAAQRPPTTVGEQPAVPEEPRAEETIATRRHRLPWLAAAAAVAAVAMVAALALIVRGRSAPDATGAAAPPPSPAPAPAFSDSLIPGDASKFVADVTIPDGTRVKVNSHFVKVWALANVGTVDWHNRFLERMNPTADGDGCRVPDRVAIGDTPPGEQVMISVPVTAPKRPGKCWVSWKMVDEQGRPFFPSRRPVYFMVNVTA